jgi:hypothetical protein
MPQEFIMKVGDTEPTLDDTLLDENLEPVNLGATTIVLHLRGRDGTTEALTPVEILSEPAGQVRYTWPTPQMRAAGVYEAEWQVTWTDGTVISFPNDGYFHIKIVGQLV